MIVPKLGSAPFGFGGPGAPPGFGSGGSSGGGNPVVPAKRPGNRAFGKVNRDPGNDPRIRSFVDLLQEMFNSLGERGFITRDNTLRWSVSLNPFQAARDPLATDAGADGDTWINTETNAVFISTPGGWVLIGAGRGLTGTFTTGVFP